ncbi:MAG: AmmeMemoRadiSam system protein A [Anaerolineales bacterium]|nr:AmmeMemoRadiSam system protein A [Anaerolineales bacterium]MCA9970291.1 AmmeMemoRadiSam system protein A [Anaerolineales bacterium]
MSAHTALQEISALPALTAEQQHELLQLARTAIQHFLETGEVLVVETADPVLQTLAGVFVTLRTRDDVSVPKNTRLRGCIGHMEADWPLAQVVAAMAVKAATRDPRFPPVVPAELDHIAIEISVLSPLQPLEDVTKIELGRHGLFISKGRHRGLLLPQVPIMFGWTPEEFLENLCRKAGLPPDAWHEAQLWWFETAVFEEE